MVMMGLTVLMAISIWVGIAVYFLLGYGDQFWRYYPNGRNTAPDSWFLIVLVVVPIVVPIIGTCIDCWWEWKQKKKEHHDDSDESTVRPDRLPE